jgi:hypothetical protein
MKKKIQGLPISFTHTTPIDHNDAPHSETVHGKNILRAANQAKETTLNGALAHQTLFLGEA